jgi:hypothetical protein
MACDPFKLSRARVALLFIAIFVLTFYRLTPRIDAAGSTDLQYYQEALSFIRGLSSRAADLFDDAGQRQLQDSALRLQFSLNYWSQFPNPGLAAQAQRDSAIAFSQVCKMLDRSTSVDRIWAGAGAPPQLTSRRWPLGSGVVLLRIGRNGAPDPGIRVFRGQYDLARAKEAVVDLGEVETTYAALFFNNAPEGERRVTIRLRAGASDLGTAELAVTTPATGTLRVSILDGATGKLTPAAAGVFASDGEIVTPAEAITFDQGGFYYQPGRVRPHQQTHYWPGRTK